MQQRKEWWEKVFVGPLALGLDTTRIDEMKDEKFIYFESEQAINKVHLQQLPT